MLLHLLHELVHGANELGLGTKLCRGVSAQLPRHNVSKSFECNGVGADASLIQRAYVLQSVAATVGQGTLGCRPEVRRPHSDTTGTAMKLHELWQLWRVDTCEEQ